MRAGFDAGTLQAFPVTQAAAQPLANALHVYRQVLAGASPRMVLRP